MPSLRPRGTNPGPARRQIALQYPRLHCRHDVARNGDGVCRNAKNCPRQRRNQNRNPLIRPALQGHGGDMTITSFSNGILKFKFTGMCSNCPSAWITTEELVKNEILSNVPEVKDVQMEFAVSDELIDMAKKLLNHET